MHMAGMVEYVLYCRHAVLLAGHTVFHSRLLQWRLNHSKSCFVVRRVFMDIDDDVAHR
jgi:hypothetical protein